MTVPPRPCPTCPAKGFDPSILGPDRCAFCDGSVGGHPPTLAEMHPTLLRGLAMQADLWSLGYPSEATQVGIVPVIDSSGVEGMGIVCRLRWGDQEWVASEPTPEWAWITPEENVALMGYCRLAWNRAMVEERIAACEAVPNRPSGVALILSLQAAGLWPIPGKAKP